MYSGLFAFLCGGPYVLAGPLFSVNFPARVVLGHCSLLCAFLVTTLYTSILFRYAVRSKHSAAERCATAVTNNKMLLKL
jgi:hypothetical protein